MKEMFQKMDERDKKQKVEAKHLQDNTVKQLTTEIQKSNRELQNQVAQLQTQQNNQAQETAALKHRLLELETIVQQMRLSPQTSNVPLSKLPPITEPKEEIGPRTPQPLSPSTPNTPKFADNTLEYRKSPPKTTPNIPNTPKTPQTPKATNSPTKATPEHTGFTPDRDTLDAMANLDLPPSTQDLPTTDDFTPVIHKKTKRNANKQKRKAANSPTSSPSSGIESPVKHRRDHRSVMDTEIGQSQEIHEHSNNNGNPTAAPQQ